MNLENLTIMALSFLIGWCATAIYYRNRYLK